MCHPSKAWVGWDSSFKGVGGMGQLGPIVESLVFMGLDICGLTKKLCVLGSIDLWLMS